MVESKKEKYLNAYRELGNSPTFWRIYFTCIVLAAAVIEWKDWSAPDVVNKLVWIVAILLFYKQACTAFKWNRFDRFMWFSYCPCIFFALFLEGNWQLLFLFLSGSVVLIYLTKSWLQIYKIKSEIKKEKLIYNEHLKNIK